ncbi:MAG: hypothetical protein EOP00_11610 [Pedobacter sp.]|nr:MAG: hypothetical protein EOP00_11610 [Pedobacter sp.]
MAVKSKNRTNVAINKNFVIRVLENPSTNSPKNTKLTSANKLSNYILDEALKIKLFAKVLEGGADKYTFKIRNRLKIEFHSK